MKKIWIALAMMLAATASPIHAQAARQAEVMATINRFVEGFNKGDTKALVKSCAAETAIIDEFPPHAWHGVGACAAWAKDYNANAKQFDITDGLVTLGKPSHLDVTGDRAYVVVPSDYTWKQKGKSMKETGSAFSFAMQKVGPAWKIAGWSWAAK
jgi:ketosteroid isomerase-like protein